MFKYEKIELNGVKGFKIYNNSDYILLVKNYFLWNEEQHFCYKVFVSKGCSKEFFKQFFSHINKYDGILMDEKNKKWCFDYENCYEYEDWFCEIGYVQHNRPYTVFKYYKTFD